MSSNESVTMGMGQYIPAFFRGLQVKGKLMLAMFVVSGLMLLLASLTVIATELALTSGQEQVDNRILAGVIARNSSAAVDFNDRRAAQETLESLQFDPEVTAAHIILPDGRLFASYIRPGESSSLRTVGAGENQRIAPGFLESLVRAERDIIPADYRYKVVVPFSRAGRQISTIVLVANLDHLKDRLSNILLMIGLLQPGSLLLCYLLASRLQRIITVPLKQLERSIQEVAQEQDYRLRVEVPGSDEIGTLSHGFNLMLEQIEQRDNELARFRLKLEDMVGDRTVELLAAKERAEEANRAKTRFLATLSHDVRTPLVGLLGIAELLLGMEQTAEQRRHLETLWRSGAALLAIMDDMLEVAKFEAGAVTLSIAQVDIQQVVDDVVALYSPLCRDEGVALSWSAPSPISPRLWGDGGKLQRILMNLVHNARKFTHEGAITITVRAVEESETEVRLRFDVADTGIGVAAHEQENIFKHYYQAESPFSAQHAGAGLGLGIVAELVSAMGGELGLVSKEGAGSTFWVTIPFARDVAAAASLWTSPRQCAGAAAVDVMPGLLPPGEAEAVVAATYPLAVLLVDDNEVVRQVAEEMLSGLGCRVTVARNGLEALQCWSGQRYDLLLMDCQMQDMDGFAATRRIRELEEAAAAGEHCLIAAMTAFAAATDLELCRAAGMDDYLRKPFNRPELAALLDRCVRGENRERLSNLTTPGESALPGRNASDAPAATTFRDYARRLVENEEALRKRLATELHDEIGRAMTTLSLTLGAIGASLPEEAKHGFLGERVDDAQKLIEAATGTIGNIMFGLRPSVLDDFGLAAAIRRHAELLERRTGVCVDVEGVGETCATLPPAQGLAMYRVYQEAMLNATLHGNPSCITVTISCNNGTTTLEISDDGCGFDLQAPAGQRPGGWGLMLMRERIEAAGGRLRLDSRPGAGTIITVEIGESG